ncbi:hypothetical protein Poly24_49320 [Rosistilla carotiformis]|uniref:Uncharacterized protein n=2 Tax=Rosistilla carotiformis TaxID=2528017 RepID=A0A518K085_9BACT|nr:hypothetical protein Poly24_49320 [Rosistilla carotiformis]
MAAATLVLAADVAVGVFLREMTLRAILLQRDPVTGLIYYALVILFALLPCLLQSFICPVEPKGTSMPRSEPDGG